MYTHYTIENILASSTPLELPYHNWFQSADFIHSQCENDYYRVTYLKEDAIIGYMHFTLSEDKLILSPFCSSIGGYESIENEPIPDIVSHLNNWIENNGWCMSELLITPPPLFYYAKEKESEQDNYWKTRERIQHFQYRNAYWLLNGESFATIIHHSERRRLCKLKKNGVNVSLNTSEHAAVYYTFLELNRRKRKQGISISQQKLESLFRYLNQRIYCFQASYQDVVIAQALIVHVSDHVAYYFLPVSNPEYDTMSPMVAILEYIYTWSTEMGFSFVDLGTSLDHLGIEKPSLIGFKERMGAKMIMKNTFRIQL